MPKKPKDDLESFLQKTSSTTIVDQPKPQTIVKDNLIEKAIEESENSLGGRPTKKDEEKATSRLIGYVKPEQKKRFTEKRGAIPESKALGLLVEKYINGEITL